MTAFEAYDAEVRAKYAQSDRDDMAKSGEAMPDGSYPIKDSADLAAAIKAVGMGNANHDTIRAHIMKRAAALGLSDQIPAGWNQDGSEKKSSNRPAPATRDERRDAVGSFGDIIDQVTTALYDFLPGYPTATGELPADVWVQDVGQDWVVFYAYDMPAPGLYSLTYSIDNDGQVVFSGDQTPVESQTTYVATERADSKTTCALCKGSGKIREGNMTCPDCAGTGKVAEKKSADRPRRQRARRDLARLPEVRRFKTELRAATDPTTGEIILRGTPIVYNTPYAVRDYMGVFNETMLPGVATRSMASSDFDCVFLFNHEGMPLARSTSGTLTFEDTPEGLVSVARVDPEQTLARDLAIAIERRDVYQMSCGFVVEDDNWDAGMENRSIGSFAELFDVSAVTYPASPTTTIDIAQRMLRAAATSNERVRRMWSISKEVREGKVLSQQNGEDLMAALDALHSVDDVDLVQITKDLIVINDAVDLGQQALSDVLGRANPDGEGDKVVASGDTEDTRSADADWLWLQRQKAI